jgi:ribosomal protein S18 acetylase RimI-like enzyme
MVTAMTEASSSDGHAGAQSARALIDTMRVMSDALGRTTPIAPGVDYYATGAWLHHMNGVVLDRRRLGNDLPELDLDRVPNDLPWTIQVVGEDPDGALDALARRYRPNRFTVPTWSRSLAAGVSDVPPVDVSVDRVGDETRARLGEVVASALEGDNTAVAAPRLLAHPGVRAYIAGGASVGLGVVDQHGWLGVYAVTTAPDARRRGLARAISHRILQDGIAAGAHSAVLQSSGMARPIYQGLGFEQSGHDIAYYGG